MITNTELINYACAQLGKHYWNGTTGQKASISLYNSNKKRLPNEYKWSYGGEYNGEKVHDCHGLIKGAFWCDSPSAGVTKYQNCYPDCDIPTAKSFCQVGIIDKNDTDTTDGKKFGIPNIPGLYLFTKNNSHIAIYLGDGMLIEAKGHAWGVVKDKIENRNFAYWGKDTVHIVFEQTQVAQSQESSEQQQIVQPIFYPDLYKNSENSWKEAIEAACEDAKKAAPSSSMTPYVRFRKNCSITDISHLPIQIPENSSLESANSYIIDFRNYEIQLDFEIASDQTEVTLFKTSKSNVTFQNFSFENQNDALNVNFIQLGQREDRLALYDCSFVNIKNIIYDSFEESISNNVSISFEYCDIKDCESIVKNATEINYKNSTCTTKGNSAINLINGNKILVDSSNIVSTNSNYLLSSKDVKVLNSSLSGKKFIDGNKLKLEKSRLVEIAPAQGDTPNENSFELGENTEILKCEFELNSTNGFVYSTDIEFTKCIFKNNIGVLFTTEASKNLSISKSMIKSDRNIVSAANGAGLNFEFCELNLKNCELPNVNPVISNCFITANDHKLFMNGAVVPNFNYNTVITNQPDMFSEVILENTKQSYCNGELLQNLILAQN